MTSSIALLRMAPLVSLVALVFLLALTFGVVSCTSTSDDVPAPGGSGVTGPSSGGATAPPNPGAAAVCDKQAAGPVSAPPGAVTVDPAVDGDLIAKTEASPPGSTFWLKPGTHRLGGGQFNQVAPKDGDTYLGAPGAIVDGRGQNMYAFATQARNVTIRNLTIRGFVPPLDQGVVNHDSGDGWVIEHNTIENNQGAALMAGARQQVRFNCLRNNGQYGMNAYQAGDKIVGMVVENNEIAGNNTENWEVKVPGCGCTGGMKFWAVNGADIRNNWIHDNHGVGLWADTNNNDFLIENNLIEGNDDEAIFYETSYNLVLRGNVLRNNTLVKGKDYADRRDEFPVGTVYLSEAGGEPRIPARTDKIEIYDNTFLDNWSGITAWENADRFCNSAANTSTGNCTLLVPNVSSCSQPAIASVPLYSDCRWKTQRLDIHDNTFVNQPGVVGCYPGFAARMAVLSNFGTYPDWSPYMGDVIQRAITRDQQNQWRNNRYTGPWTFMVANVDGSVGVADWQADPNRQDAGSTFAADQSGPACS